MTEDAKPRILLVDDDLEILEFYSEYLKGAGLGPIDTLSDPRKLMEYLENNAVAVLLLDNLMPHINGLSLLPIVAAAHPELPVILSTAVPDVSVAVSCIKEGAFDYIVKSTDLTRLEASIRHALQIRELQAEYSALKSSLLGSRLGQPEVFSHIVTRDPGMINILRYIESVAISVKPILITGESGTGKELIAQAIHKSSGRTGELVTVNIGGTDDHFIADALFGHIKGAFTGADSDKPGLTAQAEGGTLFLDEIGELNGQSQVKLLRLIEDKCYRPLGSTRFLTADLKIVAATNRDLAKEVECGRFRKDLFYRLETHRIRLPPLRERKGDIPLLTDHFARKAAASLNRNPPAIPVELYTLLTNYDFPGNVRELESLLFDAVSRSKGSRLSLESFRERVFRDEKLKEEFIESDSQDFAALLKLCVKLPGLQQAQQGLIAEAMERAGNNQGIASELLGLSRTALNRRLKTTSKTERED